MHGLQQHQEELRELRSKVDEVRDAYFTFSAPFSRGFAFLACDVEILHAFCVFYFPVPTCSLHKHTFHLHAPYVHTTFTIHTQEAQLRAQQAQQEQRRASQARLAQQARQLQEEHRHARQAQQAAASVPTSTAVNVREATRDMLRLLFQMWCDQLLSRPQKRCGQCTHYACHSGMHTGRHLSTAPRHPAGT